MFTDEYSRKCIMADVLGDAVDKCINGAESIAGHRVDTEFFEILNGLYLKAVDDLDNFLVESFKTGV